MHCVRWNCAKRRKKCISIRASQSHANHNSRNYFVQFQHFHRNSHTHTHTFNGPFYGTTRVGRYQKGKTNLDFTEARDSEWQWNQLGHMQVCTLLQTDNHASNSQLKFFYRPHAYPAAQPTASKNWRQSETVKLAQTLGQKNSSNFVTHSNKWPVFHNFSGDWSHLPPVLSEVWFSASQSLFHPRCFPEPRPPISPQLRNKVQQKLQKYTTTSISWPVFQDNLAKPVPER